jgi:hypothetical protein
MQDDIDNLRILKFTDLICGSIRRWKNKQRQIISSTTLERCQDQNGNINKPVTEKQVMQGLTVGNPVVLTCFICRKYLDEDGNQYRRTTSFWCWDCHMPLCKQSRVGEDGGRDMDCLEEHQQSEDALFACNSLHVRGTSVPEGNHVTLHKRRSQRRR